MNLRKALLLVAAPLCLTATLTPGRTAWGTTATTTFQVTATVTATCTVNADDLDFGEYSTSSGAASTTTIRITCTNGTAYGVGLDAGAGAGAVVGLRKMTSGFNTLNYTLYQDAGRTTVWGTDPGVDTVSGTGTGLLQTLTVYGSAPLGQVPPVGTYVDTIGVTVYY